jgi:hypothetical protein
VPLLDRSHMALLVPRVGAVQSSQRSPIQLEIQRYTSRDMRSSRSFEMIKGFLIALGDCMRQHMDNKNLMEFWKSIDGHERLLRTIEGAYKDTLMCETIEVSRSELTSY